MKKHGISISPVRSDQPEQKTEWIKDSRFKMSPKRHPSENVRIPEWNEMKYV